MWVSTATSPRTILQSGGRARFQCGHVFSLKDIDDMRMRFFTEGNHPQCPCCYRFSFPWKPRPGKVITSLVDNHLVRSDMDTTNPRSSRTKKGNCGKRSMPSKRGLYCHHLGMSRSHLNQCGLHRGQRKQICHSVGAAVDNCSTQHAMMAMMTFPAVSIGLLV